MLDYRNNINGDSTQTGHRNQGHSHQTQHSHEEGANRGSHRGAPVASIMNTGHQRDTETSRQQSAFLLSSPPLAALHNLTEMKFPSSTSSFLSQDYSPDTLKQMQIAMSHALSTPHGINDILSRPHATFGLPRLNSEMYLGHQARFPKLAELPGRPPIYWPGVMSEPWRPSGKWSFKFFHVSLRNLNNLCIIFV